MCLAEGASFYYWERKDGDVLTNASETNSNILRLVDLKPTDHGQYRCVAVNQYGRTFSDYAVLTIKGI